MRKNLLKVFAASAALCLVSGLALVNGGVDTAKADDGVICNYDFNDGNIGVDGDVFGNSAKLEIVDGMNSDIDGASATEGSCVKVSNRTGYWENSTFAYKVDKLDREKKYTLTFDVYHDNGEDATFGTTNRVVIVHTMPEWGQIGQPQASFSESWERMSFDFTLKDVAENNDFIYLEFAYPEATDQNENNSYTVKNTETFYIDNFSVKEYVEPAKVTSIPEPTPTAAPTDAPTAAPTAAPTEVPVVVADERLEAGYEEVVKGITYRVLDNESVAAVGFDEPKSTLTIPATVTIEEYSYKVTAIAASAFKGEDIKTLTIGVNVKSIGKAAFQKCTSLKKITIKSKLVKTVGKNAFKSTAKKVTVKVPKAKKAAYKKLLVNAGITKKVTVK